MCTYIFWGVSGTFTVPVSVEETTETDSELSEEQVCAQFMKKLEQWKVVKKDRHTLKGLYMTM